MTTLFLNAGRKHLVTTGEIVGKITGVTRLTSEVVGAIDIHQRHSLVDIADEHSELVLKKLNGIRIRGHSLKLSLATSEDKERE
jgi:ATP-dependent RNA helicase DeaD